MIFTCCCILCLLIQLTNVSSKPLVCQYYPKFQGPGTIMILRGDEIGGFGWKWSCPQLSLESAHTGEGTAENPKNASTASVSACFRTHILPKRGQNVSTWANLLGVSEFQPSLTQHVSMKRIFCLMLSLSLAFEVVVFGKAFPLKCCSHSS